MSEQLKTHENSAEKLDLSDISRDNLERVRQRAAELDNQPGPELSAIQQKVEQAAVSGQEYSSSEREDAPASHTFGAHKELKTQSYKRTLSHVQNRLKGSEKSFSKVIHSKGVDKASNIGAETVARPLGLLTGGIFAFGGSLVFLFAARHYGFRYNFSLFILLFIGGYFVGTIIEGLGKLLKRRA